MYVSDIVTDFEAEVGHKNFPNDISELQILIDLIKPADNDNVDTLVGGCTDNSRLAKMLNKLTGSSYNVDFTPCNDIERKFLEILQRDGVPKLNRNLHELTLDDFYSSDEIHAFNEQQNNSNEWDYYHETIEKETEMDLLTRAGHEKL